MNKILWAVDPFEEHAGLREHLVAALKSLAAGHPNIQVQPVFVLSPGELNLMIDFTPVWVEQYRPAAEQALQAYVDRIREQEGMPEFTSPVVLVNGLVSTTQAVRALLEHADQYQAELILTATHARRGVKRLLIGSFAETLLSYSKVPVLTVSPHTEPAQGFRKILFPTDLGKRAQDLFRQAVRLAQDYKSELHLFHVIPNPVEPVFQQGVYLLGGAWIPVHNYFDQAVTQHEEHLKAWAKWAEENCVHVEVRVETRAGSISDSIFRYAQDKRIDLLLMAARTGPVTSTLIGSITRQVVREAHCPVMVMKPMPRTRMRAPKPEVLKRVA